MNPTLKSTLMALAAASLGVAVAPGCSSDSSETPQAESSAGGEATGGEASCSGEGSCSEGSCSADMKGADEGPPAPEGTEPPIEPPPSP